jgi:hypothetical protein
MVWRTIVLTGLIFAPARAERLARLVLVVGNNRPAEAGQAPLRYADDDAIRYFERFEGLADRRIVLTRLDEDSAVYRRAHPDVAPPTRITVRKAAAELRARAAELRARGTFVEMVFVFAGHGGLEWDKPYLALEDGHLGPQDLEELLLAGQPADVTHVIIDACSAAGFVEGRGPLRGERRPLPDELLPFKGLASRYGRAGFVLAASADGNAYEWSRFGSGVASHLIRSALSGAADIGPPDGRVTYDELDAFLRRATSGVLPGDYRQEFRVLPPADLASAALVDLRAEEQAELIVDRPGRYYLRDADGHRIADFHHGKGTARLALPAYSPRFALVSVTSHGTGCQPGRWLRSCERREVTHEFEAAGSIRLSALEAGQRSVAARGVIEDSIFEQLLEEPFDAAAMRRPDPPPPPLFRPPVSIGAGYRATIGRLPDELLATHGVEFRLEFPIGVRGFFAPVAGIGHGTALPENGTQYSVFQYDAGLDGGVVLWREHLRVVGGIEARYQVLDQVLPGESDRIASAVLAGPMVRAAYPLARRVGLGVSAAGGARAGSVDDDVRVKPYIAFGASLIAEL